MVAKIEKRISRFNNSVDIAGFEKISEDEYVFTKKNFWGVEDFSKRYLLNSRDRKSIWKSYYWFWGITIAILFLSIPNRGNEGLFCYVSNMVCSNCCNIAFIFIPLSILFYRIFVMHQYKKISSLYPLYHGDTTIHNSRIYNTFRFIFIVTMGVIGFYLGVEPLIK